MSTIDRIVETLGWDDGFQSLLTKLIASHGSVSLTAARVIEEHRALFRVWGDAGVLNARLSGAFSHRGSAEGRDSFPAVGDWVAVEARLNEKAATIHALLPRRTAIVRREAQDRTVAQVLAANVDTVFLVTSCNDEFNLRRIERTLTILWESGAQPVLVLNKRDLVPDPEALREEAESAAPGVPVYTTSAMGGDGVEAIGRYLRPTSTIALVGSSGVGKSTIINCLSGHEMLATGAVRQSDSRGRHTTTYRQLIKLENGALLIDTPGIREISLWDAAQGLEETFADIEDLAASCRFNDCRHQSEPGCAVKAALEDGSLDAERLASYRKLGRELSYLERRKDEWAQREEKRRWKRISRASRKKSHH